VYSTCTTNVIENEGVIVSILEEWGESVELMNVEIEEKSVLTAPLPRCPVANTGSRRTARYSGDSPLAEGNKTLCAKVARFRPHIHHTGGFFIAKLKKKGRMQSNNNELLQVSSSQ